MAVSVRESPGPQLLPIEYVTPSRLHALASCFLQMAFDMDPLYRGQQFRGPKARLGTVCHEFLAKVTRGELASAPKAEWRPKLEALWNEEIAKEEDSLRCSPLESHFGSARRWPGYAISKARVTKKALEMLERRQQASNGAGRFWTERPYGAYQGRLRGRADAVYGVGDWVVVEEYKTSDIYDTPTESGRKVLKPSYRQQILLYAAMHHDATGNLPAVGCVVSLAGDRECIDIDLHEAEQEVAAALRSLERYNEQVARECTLESLASPSPQACRWCSYKMHCEPFWIHVSPYWDWSRNVAIDGRVLQIRGKLAGDWSIKARVRRGNAAEGIYSIHGHRRIALEEGEDIRMVNLLLSQDDGEMALIVTDYSELWTQSMLKA